MLAMRCVSYLCLTCLLWTAAKAMAVGQCLAYAGKEAELYLGSMLAVAQVADYANPKGMPWYAPWLPRCSSRA